MVLLASSRDGLQLALEQFAAECEVAGMGISTSKFERGPQSEKGGVPAPGQGL